MSQDPVALIPAAPPDRVLLSNLLELYIHDLSHVFTHLEIGADGRFGYPKLPLYFSEPDRRFAYLIRQGPRTTGFALVTRGSPVVETPDVHDVAEFFVLRQYRRAGLAACGDPPVAAVSRQVDRTRLRRQSRRSGVLEARGDGVHARNRHGIGASWHPACLASPVFRKP